MEQVILRGRGAIEGVVEGRVLVCPDSISGWGGIDPRSGEIVEFGHCHRGRSIKDAILVMPGSKGSNGWSCYFGAARVAGANPKGWIFTTIDSSSAVASAVMHIPTVVDFPPDQDPCRMIHDNDLIRMDGRTGEVTILERGDKNERA